MSHEKKAHMTFWTLIKEYEIRIPRIQRDYAQGREDNKTSQIRGKLLKDIFSRLSGEEQEPMTLNFVYGNVKNKTTDYHLPADGEGEERKKIFEPIDGQQRLTTLFFIHWYLAFRTRKIFDDNIRDILSHFKYETRILAEEFCCRLLDNKNLDNLEKRESLKTSDDEKFTYALKDSYWFSSDYEKDATIRSMLVMLDAIHEEMKKHRDMSGEMFDSLIGDKCPIDFLFMDLEKANLTEEIYIKMNARGKPLTIFENFKAQLKDYFDGVDEDFSEEFINYINGECSHFFWENYKKAEGEDKDKQIEEKLYTIDDQMLNLIRFMTVNDFIINVKDITHKKRGEILKTLRDEGDFEFASRLLRGDSKDYKYQSISITLEKEEEEIITAKPITDTFKEILKLLKCLKAHVKFKRAYNIYNKLYVDDKELITKGNLLSSENVNQVVLYAECAFLLKIADKKEYDENSERELTEWLRVIYNLARNTDDFNMERYSRCIVVIDNMLNDFKVTPGVLSFVADKFNDDNNRYSGFSAEQMKEEGIKAKLILKDEKWKELIARAERHPFLDGQIISILAFSGIEKLYETDKELSGAGVDSEYYRNFETYTDKMYLIFDDEGVRKELKDDALIYRVLLCFGGKEDYMKPIGANYSFRDKDGFKSLLSSKEPKDQREYFKELLDTIQLTDKEDNNTIQCAKDENDSEKIKNLITQLNVVIDNKKNELNGSWKEYFVRIPKIYGIFSSEQRNIRWINEYDIYLISKERLTSDYVEYYSYALFWSIREKLQIKDDKDERVFYQKGKGNEIQPFLKFKDKTCKNEWRSVRWDAKQRKFSIYGGDKPEGEPLTFGCFKSILDYIEKNICEAE